MQNVAVEKLASVVSPWHTSLFPGLLLEKKEHQSCGKVEGSHEAQTVWLQDKVAAGTET